MSLYNFKKIEKELPGIKVSYFDSLPSTQSWLLNELSMASSLDLCPHLCITDEQTSGVGRRTGTIWQAKANKNLTMSLLMPVKELESSLPMRFLYSLLLRLKDIEPNIKFKWPNDLVLHDRKLAGIMIDIVKIESFNWVVLGFGLNLFDAPLGKAFLFENARQEDVSSLVIDLVHCCLKVDELVTEHIGKSLEPYHLLHQKQVVFKSAKGIYHGIVLGIDYRGGLILDVLGQEQVFYDGHVEKWD